MVILIVCVLIGINLCDFIDSVVVYFVKFNGIFGYIIIDSREEGIFMFIISFVFVFGIKVYFV